MPKDELKYLFVTGMGRSGTTFLADLLAMIPEVSSGHERIGNREYWLLSWYLGRNYTVPFLEREKERIESEHSGKKLYVDVNSYLQNSTSELKTVFGTSNIFHLIRDPKEVIRSIYTRRNDNDIHLLPKSEEQLREWMEGDRFHQVCMNWKMAMDQLMANNIPLLRFEDLTKDYAYLRSHLLDPLAIDLKKSDWEKAKETKTNRTPSKAYRFVYAKVKGKQFQTDELGKYDSWPQPFKASFVNVCGETVSKLEYD